MSTRIYRYEVPVDDQLHEDPECVNPVHLPDREPWTEAEESASWLEDDRRAEQRMDRP
jgi:hypothetical protein